MVYKIVTEDDLGNSLLNNSGVLDVNIDNQTITKDSNGVLSAKTSKSLIKGTLGEAIPSGFLVYCNNGLYYRFDATNITLYDRLVGMTNQTGDSGAEVDIITEGICDQVSGLTPNKMYFASNGGAISLTPPTIGLRISVGNSIASNKFNVKIKDSIIKI